MWNNFLKLFWKWGGGGRLSPMPRLVNSWNCILKSVDKTNGFTCHALVETLSAVDKIPCSGVGKDAVKGQSQKLCFKVLYKIPRNIVRKFFCFQISIFHVIYWNHCVLRKRCAHFFTIKNLGLTFSTGAWELGDFNIFKNQDFLKAGFGLTRSVQSTGGENLGYGYCDENEMGFIKQTYPNATVGSSSGSKFYCSE